MEIYADLFENKTLSLFTSWVVEFNEQEIIDISPSDE